MAFGTLLTLDTMASMNNTTVPQIGEDNVFDALNASLAAHNDLLTEKLASLVVDTTDRLKRYGGVDSMNMETVDEGGSPDAQKISAGATVGFPLRLYGIALQWTRKYLQNATVAEIAAQTIAARDAHIRAADREIKRAIFGSANFTFVDVLIDGVSLAVKRLLNADSAPIPQDPNGNSFNAATHTHYLATAALVVADLVSLVETVTEHFGNGEARVYINRAQEAAVRALAGFVPYTDARIVSADNVTRALGSLNANLLYNRAIGIFTSGGVTAEIWVKPWPPASYMFSYIAGAEKPLRRRTRAAGSGGLVLQAADEAHPLRAQSFDAEFGIGVFERRNGAVLYTGGGAYVVPTIS